jgi:hypothetical protein
MKRNLLLFLILLIGLSAFSQNWAPINTTERFCYSTDDTLEIINNVLWVDSFEQNGDEQLYQLNKIARPVEDEDFQYLFNEPQFLLDQITIMENGEWIFLDTFFIPLDTLQEFSLFPNAGMNVSWDFTNDLQAEVTEMGIMEILGETDSVKTISLSDNSEIILSKEHGIVNWRNQYQLIGIEGRDLGVLVPDFEDMYANISAGDVICYDVNSWMADETVTGIYIEARYDVLSVDRYQDSIVIQVYLRSNTYYSWKETEEVRGIEELVFYRNRYTDVYPNDTIYIDYHELYTYSDGIAISKLSYHDWGGIVKTQITYDNYWPNSNLFYPCEGIYSYELCEYGETMLMEHSVKYGFLEWENAGFEWGGNRSLVGIIDDGDTLGMIYPIDMFVGTHQLTSNSNWLIYPNPAKDFITIQTPIKQSQTTYKIFNLNGLLLKEGVINQEESSISVNELPTGMYFIELIINGEKSTKKWIKN